MCECMNMRKYVLRRVLQEEWCSAMRLGHLLAYICCILMVENVHLLDLRVDAPIAPTPLLSILAYACQLHHRESSAGKGGGGRPAE